MKSPASLLLASTFQLIIFTKAAYDPTQCKITQSPSGHVQPTFDDNFYEFAEYKVTYGGASTVSNTQTYYSQFDGRVYSHVATLGNTTDYWVEAKQDQVLISVTSQAVPAADMCTASNLQGSQIGILLNASPVPGNGTQMKLGTPSQALQFSREAHKKYFVSSDFLQDRGIPVSIWKSCNWFPETDTTATMTWMFNDVSSMQMATSDKPLLIYIKAEGVDGATKQPFVSRSDFSAYAYDIDTDTNEAFQTPSHLFCQNAISTMTLPKIPDFFRYKGEQVTSYTSGNGQVILNFFEETYLSPLKLFIRDSESQPNAGSPNDVSFFRTVTDFNTGLQYTANLKSGSCAVTPIPAWNNAAFSIANGMVQMRTSSQFFDLDSSAYQYMGVHQKKSRGIQSDSYTTFFDSTDTNGRKNSLYTWDFASSAWKFIESYQKATQAMPVTVTVEKETVTYTMNIFEYATDMNKPIPDVSSCFTASTAVPVEVYFNGRFDQLVTPDPYGFQSTFRVNVMGVTLILSPIRIAKIDVQPASGNMIVVRFLLLDAPSQQGNVQYKTDSVTAQAAYSALESSVTSGQFTMNINRPLGTASVTASSLGTFDRGQFHGVQKGAQTSTTYSSGSMAGIGVGMLLAGLLLGVVAVAVLKKIRAGPQSPDTQRFANEDS